MKNELFFIAKMAVVFTVVDAFIPRAETYAKNKINHHTHSDQSTANGSDSTKETRTHSPDSHHGTPAHQCHYPYATTELHASLYDPNATHSGSCGIKEAHNERWQTQQSFVRERQPDPLTQSFKIEATDPAALKKDCGVEHDAQKSFPKFFCKR